MPDWLAMSAAVRGSPTKSHNHASTAMLLKFGREALSDILSEDARACLASTAIEAVDSLVVVGTYRMDRTDGELAIGAASSSIMHLLDQASGGVGDQTVGRTWPPTGPIERELAACLVDRLARSIEETARARCGKQIVLSRASTASSVAWDELSSNATYRLVDICDVGKERIIAALPKAFVRELFDEEVDATRDAGGSLADQWQVRLRRNIGESIVEMSCVVIEKEILVGEVQRLHIGSVLEVDASSQLMVVLTCSGHRLFEARLSQREDRYTVQILSAAPAGTKMKDAGMGDDGALALPGVVESKAQGVRAPALSSVLGRVPVTLQVVLGTVTMSVSDISVLNAGAVVVLDRKIGEPVDILVNGRPIGRGDIAVTDEAQVRFAVTITELREVATSSRDSERV
jgi:flagellar motor switch protein FliN